MREGHARNRAIHERLGLPLLETGGIVVAWSDADLAALPGILARAHANGVADARPLDPDEVRARAPATRVASSRPSPPPPPAHSPSTRARGRFVVLGKTAHCLASAIILPVPNERTKGVVICRIAYGNLLVGPPPRNRATARR